MVLPRRLLALGLIAALAGVAPAGAASSPCSSDIIVFSWNQDAQLAALAPNGLVCVGTELVSVSAGQTNPVDSRVLQPLSDSISIRYPNEVKGDPGLLKARLDGLGFQGKVIFLAKDTTTTGDSTVYDSAVLTLPDGSAASGCLKIRVYYVKTIKKKTADGIKKIKKTILSERTAWHTFDQVC